MVHSKSSIQCFGISRFLGALCSANTELSDGVKTVSLNPLTLNPKTSQAA